MIMEERGRGGGTLSKDPHPIPISSIRHAESEFNNVQSILENGKETEENWERRDETLQRLRSVLRGCDDWINEYDSDNTSRKDKEDIVIAGIVKSLQGIVVAVCRYVSISWSLVQI
ncbi:hypothetical protein BKA69DRAFT_380603 [Paraphysoderma sedebokerense]|nr:hypothetical protein BKA69DRAFT_380603 [Paraphysoderma sedebokerense]